MHHEFGEHSRNHLTANTCIERVLHFIHDAYSSPLSLQAHRPPYIPFFISKSTSPYRFAYSIVPLLSLSTIQSEIAAEKPSHLCPLMLDPWLHNCNTHHTTCMQNHPVCVQALHSPSLHFSPSNVRDLLHFPKRSEATTECEKIRNHMSPNHLYWQQM